jgi:hypothetical protein
MTFLPFLYAQMKIAALCYTFIIPLINNTLVRNISTLSPIISQCNMHQVVSPDIK